jgi:hypothetical protein
VHQPPNHTSFQDTLTSHPFYNFLYSNPHLDDSILPTLAAALQSGQLAGSCDGSFDPIRQTASYGVVFGTETGPLLCFSGPCPGCPPFLSAQRAELCSITASLCILQLLCETFVTTAYSITIYNNCSKALKLINKSGRKFKRFLADAFDLHQESRVLLSQIRNLNTVGLAWVKGYYTGKERRLEHDLNQEAHHLATSFTPSPCFQQADDLPPSSTAFLILTAHLNSKWQATMSERLHSIAIEKNICKNSSWTSKQFNMIDWKALHQCLEGLPRLRQLSYCKLTHGLLHTNSQKNKYYKLTADCPLCGLSPETINHILCCSHQEAIDAHLKQQEALWKQLSSINTPPLVLLHLQQGIQGHLDGST